MQILSLKPGHDGSLAYIDNQHLVFSYESEKDSYPRFSEITPEVLISSFASMPEIPDVLCASGWVRGYHSIDMPAHAGYYGLDVNNSDETAILLGKKVKYFSSSHERSHIMCAYGMSPFPQGEPCYCLLMEGNIGAFYEIDESVNIHKIKDILPDPGNKYAFGFALADANHIDGLRLVDAGKMMALCGCAKEISNSEDIKRCVEKIINSYTLLDGRKKHFKWSAIHNIGHDAQSFRNFAKQLSDEIFNRFLEFARQNLTKGYPLIISGGCGLNCDWNSLWNNCGLFADVFVPPCTNDTGSAIGTAVDAQNHLTGIAKIDWSVYAGQKFVFDTDDHGEFQFVGHKMSDAAHDLENGKIIAFVNGRCEMGPRALGNRSILAHPFSKSMRRHLNTLKNREDYRPIAPVCLEEDFPLYFNGKFPSEFMLYFQTVHSTEIPAVTHQNNTARVQTVSRTQNEDLHELLQCFRSITGHGLLCNTSLNFHGKGFINRTSDLIKFATLKNIDGIWLDGSYYRSQ